MGGIAIAYRLSSLAEREPFCIFLFFGGTDNAKQGMTEIRWHGRGGQGAKSACLLLAEVAGQQGKFVQGFPEYGPGAWARRLPPITAFVPSAALSTPTYMNRIMWLC
jgi:hypothetical protein